MRRESALVRAKLSRLTKTTPRLELIKHIADIFDFKGEDGTKLIINLRETSFIINTNSDEKDPWHP